MNDESVTKKAGKPATKTKKETQRSTRKSKA